MIPGSTADFTGTTPNSLRHPLPAEQVEAIYHRQSRIHVRLCRPDGRWCLLAAQRLAGPPPASHCCSRWDLFEPIMLQSNEICDRIPGRARHRSRNHCSDPSERAFVRTDSRRVATVAIAPACWCARCCATTNPTRSTPSSYPPDFGHGGWWLQRIPLHVLRLTDERIAYADGWLRPTSDSSSITLNGWEIHAAAPSQSRPIEIGCVVEGNTSLCNLHGWQCLDDGRRSPPGAINHAVHGHDAVPTTTALCQLIVLHLMLRRYHFLSSSGTAKVIHWNRSADIRLNRWAF